MTEGWVVITFLGEDYDFSYEPEDVSDVFGPFQNRESAMFWAKRNVTSAWVHRRLAAPRDGLGAA